MMRDRGKQVLWTVLGVSAGVGMATGVWLWRRETERRRPHTRRERGRRLHGPGAEVADRLRQDEALARRAIEVDSITDGVVELTGRVETHEEAERAMRLAQDTPEVFTVVNRIVIGAEETRRAETLRRRENGAPELTERHHYGMGVGMGTRRQSPSTDPDRPSDKQKMLDQELDVTNVEDAAESGPDPISGAEAVGSSDLKPAEEMEIRDAGLDSSPRPTSTPEESDRREGEGVEEEPTT
ncbi:MAG: BON domain-containing protein [Gemmatimonadota bacterium]